MAGRPSNLATVVRFGSLAAGVFIGGQQSSAFVANQKAIFEKEKTDALNLRDNEIGALKQRYEPRREEEGGKTVDPTAFFTDEFDDPVKK